MTKVLRLDQVSTLKDLRLDLDLQKKDFWTSLVWSTDWFWRLRERILQTNLLVPSRNRRPVVCLLNLAKQVLAPPVEAVYQIRHGHHVLAPLLAFDAGWLPVGGPGTHHARDSSRGPRTSVQEVPLLLFCTSPWGLQLLATFCPETPHMWAQPWESDQVHWPRWCTILQCLSVSRKFLANLMINRKQRDSNI